MTQRIFLAHTATHWAVIVATSHDEARALYKQDDVTVLSCREAVGHDVTGSFGAARVVKAFKRPQPRKGTVKL